jgi:uncharacterized protein YcaQ
VPVPVPVPAPARLTAAQARRIALAAQGFGRPRQNRPPGATQIASLIRRLCVLQLDSVNVLCRSHYLPVFARLGPYDPAILDRLTGHDGVRGAHRRPFTEYWAHEASLIATELQPLLRWRMAGVERFAWGSIRRIAHERPELVAATLELVRRDGPIRAADTEGERSERRPGEMWNWHEGKRALEYLFFTGQVASAGRINFERRYDIAERVLPSEVTGFPTPAPEDAQRELVRRAAAALGVATEADLADYFRLPRALAKERTAELLAAGELEPVQIEGWEAPAYLWPAARRPRRIRARALLSPFDSLVWFRPRAERLFGFTYRIEIYTPAHKRVHGYYVLPFLLGEDLVARVDLKADRQAGTLRVRSAFGEPGFDPRAVARELADELAAMAGWLGLERIEVEPRGDVLAGELARAVAAGAA